MSSILVWGKTREIVSGALPPGISIEEVSTLSEMKAELRAKGSILVLADASHLDAERDAIAAWIKSGESRLSLLVGVAPVEETDELARRHPYLDDVMVRPVTAMRLRLRLDRALDGLNSRRVIQQLDAALARKSQDLHELNNIGVALSAQRDINKLLELILAKCRAITASDAGTLYLVVRGKDQAAQTELGFVLAQNESVPVSFVKRTVPVDERGVRQLAAQPGRGRLREPPAHPGHPQPVRLVRARLGDGDRAPGPHHHGPLGPRGHPHGGPRREGRRARRRSLPRRELH